MFYRFINFSTRFNYNILVLTENFNFINTDTTKMLCCLLVKFPIDEEINFINKKYVKFVYMENVCYFCYRAGAVC